MIIVLLLAMGLGIAALVVIAPIFLNDPFKEPPPWVDVSDRVVGEVTTEPGRPDA